MPIHAFVHVRTAVVVVLFALALSLAGCAAACGCAPLLTPEPGAISREKAIAAAIATVPDAADPSVIWANVWPNPFSRGQSQQELAWEVRLQVDSAAPSCSPGFLDREASPTDSLCLDQENGLVVVLDQFSGAFLGWTH